MNKNWTAKEDKLVTSKYSKLGAIELAKIMGRTYNSVKHRAIKLNIKSKITTRNCRQTSVDETKFSKPLTLESCYWAGFIAADGCIYKNRFSISLNNRDIKHLQNLKTFINFNGKITLNKNDSSQFSTHSKLLCENLTKNFNITSRKTFTLKPPKGLTKRQSLAFIKGYIDGDGCLGFYANRYMLNILGTHEMLFWISSILCPINTNMNKPKISKRNNIYVLWFTGKQCIPILLALKNSTINGLSRKWNKL